jgi:hypothetical protein
MEIKQLTLNFEKGLADAWSSCREYVAYRVHHQGKPQKVVAADMDYSPSDLSRKLAQNPDDSRRFTLDDLEKYMDVTGDTRPVLYLVEKYLARSSREALEKQIAELQKQLEAGDE